MLRAPWILGVWMVVPHGGVVPVDTEMLPRPMLVTSDGRNVFVRYDFPSDAPNDEQQCRITAFRAGPDGADEVLWRAQGWFSFQSWLSDDGHFLARMGNWSRGDGPEAADLAIAFHKDGELLRSYSTRDLVQDDARVVRSVSHYMWLKDSPRFSDTWDGGLLELTTMDDIAYTFDIQTGEIVSQVQRIPNPWQDAGPLAESATLEITDAVHAYYKDLSARDWTAFATHFHDGAVLSTRWTPPDAEAPVVMMSSVVEFVERAPEGPGSQPIFEEWPTSIDVRRQGDMAVAWVTYRVRFGEPDALQEWGGVDAITLIRHEGRWRITSLAWAGD